jgi:hypothetical protein
MVVILTAMVARHECAHGENGRTLFSPHLDHEPAEQSGERAAEDEADGEPAHAALGAVEPLAEGSAAEWQQKREQATGSEYRSFLQQAELKGEYSTGPSARPR